MWAGPHTSNKSVYNCLKLSYDYLRGDNIRSCFLLCSIFPEDFLIDIELLIMFGIGYGLFSHIHSIEDLRREICGALKKLQEFGLLLKIGDDEFDDDDDDEIFISMHDVVRDFAHWMMLKEENIFMVKEGLTKWPINESFECHTLISFWNSKINNFPGKLEFPKLKIFVFSGKNFVRVPTAFVEGMKALQVLHLINVGFSLEIFKFVINLRTLCIKNCELKDISSLKYLRDLEILVLLDTNIYELPEELVALSRLKSLHFSYSGKQHCKFPHNLLSRLTSLQELHVTCPNNIDLSELNSLFGLTALSLTISTDQCFPKNFVFPKLQRYMIAVNEDNLRFMQGLNFRALEIKDFSASLSAFKELFCNVENLALDCCNDMECLMDSTRDKEPITAFSNLVKLYMEDMPCLKELSYGQPPIRFLQKLKDVNIQFCEQLKVVFQMEGIFANEEISQTPLLSDLTSLDLIFLPKLESIWKLQSTHQYHASLRSLRAVKIHLCNELKSIFSTCVAQNLLHLQQLDISNCEELEDVFDFPQGMAQLEVPSLSNLIDLDLEILPKLKWIWKGPTHFINLKSLKTMRISYCMKLAYLFPAPLAQSLVHLEQLQILSCDSLEHIMTEEEENEDEIVSDILQHHHPLCFPKLRTLEIIYCGSLKYVFPITLAQGLPYLESVVITNCSQLKQVFKMMKENGGSSREDIVLQRLQFLKLENLDNFSSFCPEDFVISLSLKEFKVCNCPRLAHFGNQQGVPSNVEFEDVRSYGFKELLCSAKNVTMDAIICQKNLFPTVDPKGLNEITFLTLKDGKELECLIDTTDQGHVSTVAFFNLVDLVIEKMTGFKMLCNGPFPKGFLQKLEKLETSNCMELVSLSPALQNLKEVRVINCGQLRDVFQTEELLHDMEENQAPLLSNLTKLELKSLPELNCVWKGPNRYVSLQSLKIAEISQCNRLKYLFSPSLAQSLVLLEQLRIKNCCGLEHIIKELEVDDNIESNDGHLHPPLLPKLTTLQIHYCTRLEYVFQIPLAQGLPHLKSLSITNASQLKHVFNVAKEKNAVHHAIVLPRLQLLRLENLTNLSCFCSENYPIVSPSLKMLIVVVCPRFEIFTIQQDINERLQLEELKLSELGHDNECDKISRENIFQIQAKHFLSRIDVIYQLQGPIQVASLQYLRELEVSKCKRLKSLFSHVLAQNLPQLNFLHIESCEQLEEIIEMDQTSIASSSQGHLQPIFFPSLELIWIDRCSNLKSLFPINVIRSLLKLKDIEIHAASKLEQIFGYQGEPDVKDDQKEIVFPELEDVVISKLPSLKSFAPMGYHFQIPSLDYIQIKECPNLTTSFSMGSNSKHPVHDRKKEPRKVHNNAMKEMVDNQSTSNDMIWRRWVVKGQIPSYMNVGETRIMLHNEVKNKEKLVS